MAGNSQRKGAMRNAGTKKGATVGSGGQRRKQLKGKGPTPKAEDRPYHKAAKQKKAAEKRASADGRTPTRNAGRSDASLLLMGRNPVLEALQAGVPARTLYLQARLESDERWRESVRLAALAGIPISETTRTDLDRMTNGGVHQGVALAMPAYEYADLDDLATGSLLVALDGVTDPHNLGAISRSAAAFGADGLIIPTRRTATVTAAAWKASAGALSRVPVAQVTNLTRSITALKKQGFVAIGLDVDGEAGFGALPEGTLSDAVLLVIGSEGDGLSRLVAETCDWLVRIPMRRDTESLNASVAAGIALNSVFEQRS